MDRYEKILRYLFEDGPVPECFVHLEKDCYEYACDLADGDEPTEAQNFEGWLLMIEDAMAISNNVINSKTK
jgi:hypothetical protein